MSIHKQYNLVFEAVYIEKFSITIPNCRVNQEGVLPHLQGELASIIDSGNGRSGGLVDGILEDIQQILDGTWEGVESEDDNIFYTETNECVRLDLNDGYAYLGQEDYGWAELPRIPLIDLKSIFEEWIVFRNSVYNNPTPNKPKTKQHQSKIQALISCIRKKIFL